MENDVKEKEKKDDQREPKKAGGIVLQNAVIYATDSSGSIEKKSPDVEVRLKRSVVSPTYDQMLWVFIRNSLKALSFKSFEDFMNLITSADKDKKKAKMEIGSYSSKRALPFPDIEAYRFLKVATEVFLTTNCGVSLNQADPAVLSNLDLNEEQNRMNRQVDLDDIKKIWWDNYLKKIYGDDVKTIPYLALIKQKFPELKAYYPTTQDSDVMDITKSIQQKLTCPCFLELIWSYWQEEGMLVQTMNAISLRFQNKRINDRDPLAELAIDPLRPLNNLLWGYIQDEQHRLSLQRRTYEYDHQYGLSLLGKAVPRLNAADSRTKFLEGFHNLLHLCSIFYKEDDDTTIIADGFPLLNALREVHLILSQGQHNQYGDLPWTARQEMLMQQWILSRPEMREFLPSRIMVAYPEPWMAYVDTMKKLQGWTNTSILHFRDLAVYGEPILLSIRFGDWNDSNKGRDEAANWARYWRQEIQGYTHAYRTVTGVDLTSEPVDATMPAVYLQKRLTLQKAG